MLARPAHSGHLALPCWKNGDTRLGRDRTPAEGADAARPGRRPGGSRPTAVAARRLSARLFRPPAGIGRAGPGGPGPGDPAGRPPEARDLGPDDAVHALGL